MGEKTLEALLADLQSQMAMTDSLTRPRPPGINGALEVLLLERQDIRLRMEGDRNHQRPHLHIDYRKERHAASYAIDTGERLVGSLGTKYDRDIKNWIEANRGTLHAVYMGLQGGESVSHLVVELNCSRFG